MYYAVKNGRNPGIYSTWDECREKLQVLAVQPTKSSKLLKKQKAI